MKLREKGFAIVFVLLMIAFLTSLAITAWHRMSFFCDLNLERENFYKNFCLTEFLFNKSLGLVKRNFDQYLKQVTLKGPLFFDCSNWIKDSLLKEDFLELRAFLELNKSYKKRKMYLALMLKDKEKILCKLSCLLSKINNENSRGAVNELVVEYFTINDLL